MIIYLDMDGTIADFYSVPNWLEHLNNNNTYPYRVAQSLLTQKDIIFLKEWIAAGNQIGIISWLSKNGTKKYNSAVRAAKLRWLKRNIPLQLHEIHILKYGTPKTKYSTGNNNILVDDEERNLKEWGNNGGIAWTPQQFKEIVNRY